MKKMMAVLISSLFFLGAAHADEMKKSAAKTEAKKDEKKSSAHFVGKDPGKKDASKPEMKKTDKK
jgi:hypothetical protein